MRLPNVARAARNLAGVGLRRIERQWRGATGVMARWGRKARRHGEQLSHAPALVRARVLQVLAAIERSRKRVARFDDHALTPFRTERRVTRALATASLGRVVIAGPWTSEVGYEALYWVPFLRWATDRYALRPEQVIAVSRGGTAEWYRGFASRYVEIFDLIDPKAFAAEAALQRERGDQKRMEMSALDHDLVRRASERLGIRDAVVWHPGLMYQLFRAFWHGDRALDFLLRHTEFRRLALPVSRAVGPLPEGYAAVKLYTGPALPDTPANREALHGIVTRLAARMPVVLLDTAWSVDEHRDYDFEGIAGVTTLRPSLDPRTNLGVQSEIIAGASMFLGTCGGLAWLAPFLGVETLAVYDDDRYLASHLYAARYAYRRVGAARFSTLSLKALQGVRSRPVGVPAIIPQVS
jgi:hypothetical protein